MVESIDRRTSSVVSGGSIRQGLGSITHLACQRRPGEEPAGSGWVVHSSFLFELSSLQF